MAALVSGGTSKPARTSSASAWPTLSRSGRSSAGRGSKRARIVASASSTLITDRWPGLAFSARCLGRWRARRLASAGRGRAHFGHSDRGGAGLGSASRRRASGGGRRWRGGRGRTGGAVLLLGERVLVAYRRPELPDALPER